ncbi:secondary thiamine-phosphate synthase enzyme YjbQ [Altericroceibacterium xinjiangense]|uniref:secondary thiamine-phosphate synthase enzyme YjbQ n=1 Tax=Altericroceibacterium xinjiangense TaxID=762261 RepID=UPI000F7F84FE|nr:secondary thiamine-phosphate synthase enzyme YjbQ [Altericroceibacterium xinjiangense]
MRQEITTLSFSTPGRGFIEITDDVAGWLSRSGIRTGLVTVFCQHTSASLTINENAAPAVRRDLLRWLDGIAPEGDGYEHDDEGPDDMPAHIKAMLTGNSLTIPVENGRMMLGTWQGIYLVEHRRRGHARRVAVHILGQ